MPLRTLRPIPHNSRRSLGKSGSLNPKPPNTRKQSAPIPVRQRTISLYVPRGSHLPVVQMAVHVDGGTGHCRMPHAALTRHWASVSPRPFWCISICKHPITEALMPLNNIVGKEIQPINSSTPSEHRLCVSCLGQWYGRPRVGASTAQSLWLRVSYCMHKACRHRACCISIYGLGFQV